MARSSRSIGFWATLLVAIIMALAGLVLLIGGIWLLTLGGSWYYAAAGLGVLVSAYFLFRREMLGFWIYAATFVATLMWALWGAGFNGWAQVPRLIAPTVVLVLVALLIPALRGRPRMSRTAVTLAAAGVFAVSMSVFLLTTVRNDVIFAQEPAPAAADPLTAAASRAIADGAPLEAGVDWPAYGGTQLATRYSTLAQITPANVQQLEKVWEFRTGDLPQNDEPFGNQNTPVKVGDKLYVCSALNKISALDAATGVQAWTYDPRTPADAVGYNASCRGLVYFADPAATAGSICAARVVFLTHDARMIALDTETGEPCPAFGTAGLVNLLEGIGDTAPGFYAPTSPPTLVRDVLVVGSQVSDGQTREAPSGVIRGYNVVTGALAWAWDMGRPGETGLPPAGEIYTPGTPNVWTIASGDDQLGLVYLPMGNSAVDYWGSDRSEAENTYSTAIVALDVETGAVAWHYQTVHYDVWDYDLGGQGSLVDFPTASGPVPAIIMPSKQGQFYILDRATGAPLVTIEERPAPQGGVEPERLSPTQPFVTDFPNLLKPDLTEADMWGMTPFDQLWCRIQFRQASYAGVYTPPTVDRPWIQFPGYNGGSDWGGIAVDPVRNILVANYNNMPNYNQLVPRAEVDALGVVPITDPNYDADAGSGSHGSLSPQALTPYGIRVNAGWRVPFTGLLCKEPPYGGITAIDLSTRKVLWDRPFGSARNNGPFGIPSMLPIDIGTPNNGGGVATASGLFFISAATDDILRAIDISTGKELWQTVLPAGGQATPMTYEADGRQIVVINAGGHDFMETTIGDYFIAFALPNATP